MEKSRLAFLCLLFGFILILPTNTRIVRAAENEPLISDERFVLSPSYFGFKADALFKQRNSGLTKLKVNHEEKAKIQNDGKAIPASDVIMFYAHYYSINPQVLLTFMEVASGSVRSSKVPDQNSLANAFHYNGSNGFIAQVESLSRDLATAYYADPNSVSFAGSPNRSSFAVKQVIGKVQNNKGQVSTESEFAQTFSDLFGDPLSGSLSVISTNAVVDPDDPNADYEEGGEAIPTFFLPLQSGFTWYYSGGPHCYWGNNCTPISAVDFSPGPSSNYGCNWTSTSEIRPAATGYVIYANYNLVKIHHSSNIWVPGWQTWYYHVRSINVAEEQWVSTATRVGYPSCEAASDGEANGVHLHFAFSKNGNFKTSNGKYLSGWQIWKGSTQYNGTMVKNGVTKTADTVKSSSNAITK